jgi:MFS family permease
MKGFRRCIFISEGIYAAIILFVGHLDLHEDFYFTLTLIVMSFVASATQDIATDALAVLTFKKKDKGLVNSMQSLGSFAATLIGSGFLLVLLQKYGWHHILPFMSIFVIIAIIPLWRNKSLKITPQPASEPVSKADFIWFFTRKSIWRQIGFLSLYYAGIIGSLSMFRPYLVDLGYSMQ